MTIKNLHSNLRCLKFLNYKIRLVISMRIYILQNHIVEKKISNDGIAYTERVPQRVKISRPFYPPPKKVCSGRSINFNPNTFFQVFSFMCHTQSCDDDHSLH